jgi:hypothetical protein
MLSFVILPLGAEKCDCRLSLHWSYTYCMDHTAYCWCGIDTIIIIIIIIIIIRFSD